MRHAGFPTAPRATGLFPLRPDDRAYLTLRQPVRRDRTGPALHAGHPARKGTLGYEAA